MKYNATTGMHELEEGDAEAQFAAVPSGDFSGYKMSTFPVTNINNNMPVEEGILNPFVVRNVQQNFPVDNSPFNIDNRLFKNLDTSSDLTYDYNIEDQKGFEDSIKEEDEDKKFDILQYLPFGEKSVSGAIMKGIGNLIPDRDSRQTALDAFYTTGEGAQYMNPNSQSYIPGMENYNTVSGGLVNFLTDGRYGNPTTYGLQKAYQKRIDTINKTLARKKAKGLELSGTLTQRKADLEAAKAAELAELQAAQKTNEERIIADAYATQTGPGSRYTGGDDNREARSTGNYFDPFDPGTAD